MPVSCVKRFRKMSRNGTIAGSEKLPMVIEPPDAPPDELLLLPPQAASNGLSESAAPVPTAPRITSLRVYERWSRSRPVWSLMLHSFGRLTTVDGGAGIGVEEMQMRGIGQHAALVAHRWIDTRGGAQVDQIVAYAQREQRLVAQRLDHVDLGRERVGGTGLDHAGMLRPEAERGRSAVIG